MSGERELHKMPPKLLALYFAYHEIHATGLQAHMPSPFPKNLHFFHFYISSSTLRNLSILDHVEGSQLLDHVKFLPIIGNFTFLFFRKLRKLTFCFSSLNWGLSLVYFLCTWVMHVHAFNKIDWLIKKSSTLSIWQKYHYGLLFHRNITSTWS